MMKKICSRELHYETVDRMFFLSPGTTLADGVHVIASNDDVDKVILDSRTMNAGTVNVGMPSATENLFTPQGEVDVNVTAERPKRTRRNRCGHCGELGHTARTCLIRRGVQAAVVDPNTTRRVRRREERAVLGGVGVYNNEETGNMYYRGGTSTSRRHAEQEEIGPSQPPPGTQPSQ
ncbi:hypothetical protein LINGRAHAP2_LOCUS23651 [Linum grandiflorum]